MIQMMEITIYRTYHPFVHRYLRQFDIPYKSEAFGLLMTLDIADVLAKRIAALLPTGAVVDMYDLSEEEILFELDKGEYSGYYKRLKEVN